MGPRAVDRPDSVDLLPALSERAGTGALVGGIGGLVVSIVWARGRHGVPGGPYDVLPLLVAFAWRNLLPTTLAGALVGALYGALLRWVYRLLGALLLTSGLLALYVAVVQLVPTGGQELGEQFYGSVALAALVGVPVAVLVRDMLLYLLPAGEPLERRSSSFAWAFVNLLQRLPGFGQPLRHRRRARLLDRAFPRKWLQVLQQRVPVYGRLPVAQQAELRRQIVLFLEEKKIEGCGLVVTDAVRVTIAAEACLLTLGLGRPAVDCYSRLRTILVYPETFLPQRVRLDAAEPTDEPTATLGESWRAGVVVLSWKSVREGVADPDDGENVALHEFAHQLDQENGGADGLPFLEPPVRYADWTRVLQREYQKLRREEALHAETVLSFYGTKNLAEFFAVATEAFFERPLQLQRERPALYEQLRFFYRQDPAQRVPPDQRPPEEAAAAGPAGG